MMFTPDRFHDEPNNVPQTPSNPEMTAPLRFQTRRDDRLRLDGVATCFLLEGSRFGEMHELIAIDYAAGGLGANSREPIEPGTPISIGFSATGYIARRGKVVHCQEADEGYRISIEFETRLAA